MHNIITQNALSILPCRLVWLLVLDNQELVTGAVATDIGESSAEQFLRMVQLNHPQGRFPLQPNHNPMAEVLLRKTSLDNLTPSELALKAGGKHFAPVLVDFGIYAISFLPLIQQDRPLGVLVLGFSDTRFAKTTEGQKSIQVIHQQALLHLDNMALQQQVGRMQKQMQSEQTFRSLILETVGDGMVATNDKAQIVRVSRKLFMMLGYTAQELVGKPVSMLFSQQSQLALMRSLLTNNQATMSFAQELITKAGKPIPVLMSRITTQHLENVEESAIIIFNDLSILEQRQHALERQTNRLQVLYRAAQAISSQLSLHEVIEIILSSALEVLQGVVASILLRDVDNPEELIFVATVGPYAERMNGRRVPIGLGIVGQVASTARPRLVSDVTQTSDFLRGFDSDPDLDVKTIAVVPLMASDNVIGILEIVNKQTGSAFEAEDLAILENLGASAAVAIERASLFDQTHRRLIEMGTLLEASSAVTSTLELDKILELIARRLRDSLNVQHVVIATRESAAHPHVNVHAQVVNAQWERELDSCPQIALEQAPFKLAAVSQRRLTHVDWTTPNISPIERREMELRGMRITFNVPLRLSNRLVGVISLYHTDLNFDFTSVHSTTIDDAVLAWEQQALVPSEELSDLCTRVMQATGISWCSLYLLDPNKEKLFLMREIGTGLWKDGNGLSWELADHPTLRHALEDNESQLVWSDSLEDDPAEQAYLKHIGAGSCLIAPLIIRGEARGLVKLMTTDHRIFDDSEISLCQGIANVVGNAIENASLFASLEQRAQALEGAYHELEEADRLKDDLLQNVSHELSTPLMHALGYLSLLKDEAFGTLNKEQQETLDLINRKTQSVADLVKNMVAVHASGAQKLELKSAKIEQVAALTVRSLTPKASAANISIVPRIAHNLPSVMIDRVRIGEVFEALIDNAIKFSPHGSKIEIGIEDKSGPMVQIYIKDEGIGIDPAEHEKIFRRFYQVDGGTTRRYGGVGLGLAIVLNVIKSHGGRVWVESALGKGTTIYFTVPKSIVDENSQNRSNAFA